jgi:dTDP-4-amino-4,6-dideoxygalactose transaminase
MKKTFVTKTYLPEKEKFQTYIDQLWQTGHITNNGPIMMKLEQELKDFLNIDHFQFVTNGTLALQIALRALDITDGDIITTPFSYVATTTSILWERCNPVFVDIDPSTFCIDPNKIEAAITNKTVAIMAVHVFGYPCAVEAIEDIAKRHGLKVIYDAAHAFGSVYKGKSLLDYGDIATCSFHATKVFHTIEGGAVICHDPKINQYIGLLKSFGHIGDEYFEMGINAKGSEFQAAMGLCNLADFADVQKKREAVAATYNSVLPLDKIGRPHIPADFKYNYAYYPVIFADAATRAEVTKQLNANNIFPRRYFYPSLNTLPYLRNTAPCPVSESIASRILCLPFFDALDDDTINNIARIIKAAL